MSPSCTSLAPDVTVSTSTNDSTLYIMVLQVCVQRREFIRVVRPRMARKQNGGYNADFSLGGPGGEF